MIVALARRRRGWSRHARIRPAASLLAIAAGLAIQPAPAANFDLFGLNSSLTLTGTYALGMRVESPDDRVIDAPGREEVPIAEELKFPESNNFDDGDRNFDKYALVNNRATMLGEMEIDFAENKGIKISGDGFYDNVYNRHNDNDAPDRLNSRQEPPDSFNNAAEYFNGHRARLLDAYAFATFHVFGDRALDLKIGKHIAAWGQSLFFYGVALSMSTADATKANVPGADIKSILLPENQVSMRFSLTNKITLLGDYQFEHRPFELNPDGGYYSVADIVGPGAEFAYGIRNPFYPDTLSRFNITDPTDLAAAVHTIDEAFDDQLPDDAATIVGTTLPGGLPPAQLTATGENPLNAPRGINPERLHDITPDKGQWGVGLDYALTYTTTLGFYHLNYHNNTPSVQLNFSGDAVLIPSQGPGLPPLTAGDLNLNVPTTYNVKYFDDIKLDAMSFSTVLFGANVGGELIYRDGVDVLADVDDGVAGIVPTPARAKAYQALLNGIYLLGPGRFWDSVILVGEVGYIYVNDVQGQPSQEGAHQGEKFNELTFDKDAAAFALLAMIQNRDVFSGWDIQIPVSVQGQVYHRPAMAGAFGALLGENDYRFGIGVEFTRLQALTIGLRYSAFIGPADFLARPLQDRDNISLSVKYDFL